MTARTICTVALTLVASAALAAAISEGLAHATPISNWVPIPPDASSHASSIAPHLQSEAGSGSPAEPSAHISTVQAPPQVLQSTPTIDDVQRLWRRGEYVAVGVLGLYLLLVFAAKIDRKRALIWTAGVAVFATPVDLIANGQTPNLGMLLGAGAAFIGLLQHSPLAPAPYAPPLRLPTERGSVPVSLLAWLCSAVLLVGGAGFAASCSGAQRRGVAAAVVDCTIGTLAEHAEELKGLAKAAIKTGDWDALGRAAKPWGIEDAGCSVATALAELLAPPAAGVAERSLTATPGPAPATLRAGWERLRDGALGGRHFVTQGGLL